MKRIGLPLLRKTCWLITIIFSLAAATLTANATNLPAQAATLASQRALAPLTPVADNLAKAVQAGQPDFASFSGRWYQHGAVLLIKANGQATFIGRVYRWCGNGVTAPCDYFQKNTIINGYQEKVQFFRAVDGTAYGIIQQSNLHPVGMIVTATLQPNDELRYGGIKALDRESIRYFCGPKAQVGACGA